MNRALWDTTKQNNICVMAVPKGEEREKGTEKLFEEIMAKDFPNLRIEMDIQIQEVQKIPTGINLRRLTPRHIKIKLSKVTDKERILKAVHDLSCTREHLLDYQQISQQKTYMIEGSGVLYKKYQKKGRKKHL